MSKRTLEYKLATARHMAKRLNELLEDAAVAVDQIDESRELIQVKAEKAALRSALAYYYTPSEEERIDFNNHCYEISGAGGCPPDDAVHWADQAMRTWEIIHDV